MAVDSSNMDRYRIPNLGRACQILKLFASSSEDLSSSEIARRFSMPRTTVLRIVQTLCGEGLLVHEGSHYRAGPELVRLGMQGFGSARVRGLSIPILQTLAQATGETAHLALLYRDKALVAEVCDSPAPVRATSQPGTLADIHACATGKVLLTYLFYARGDSSLAGIKLAPRTPKTLTKRAALQAECAEIHRQGYALDDEEYHIGVRCLAAPVFAASGTVVAALGITASIMTFPKRRIPEVAKHVMQAAGKLTQQLGGR